MEVRRSGGLVSPEQVVCILNVGDLAIVKDKAMASFSAPFLIRKVLPPRARPTLPLARGQSRFPAETG